MHQDPTVAEITDRQSCGAAVAPVEEPRELSAATAREMESSPAEAEQTNVSPDESPVERGSNSPETHIIEDDATVVAQQGVGMDVKESGNEQIIPDETVRSGIANTSVANNVDDEPDICLIVATAEEEVAPRATEEAIDPTEEAIDPTKEAIDPTKEAIDPTEGNGAPHVHSERQQNVTKSVVRTRIASTQPARRSIRIIRQVHTLRPADTRYVSSLVACHTPEDTNEAPVVHDEINTAADVHDATTTATAAAAVNSRDARRDDGHNCLYHNTAARRQLGRRITVSPVAAAAEQQPSTAATAETPAHAQKSHTGRGPTRSAGTRARAAAAENHALELLQKHTADLAVSQQNRRKHIRQRPSSTVAATGSIPGNRSRHPARRARPSAQAHQQVAPTANASAESTFDGTAMQQQTVPLHRQRVLIPDSRLVAELRKLAAAAPRSADSPLLPVKLDPLHEDIIPMPTALETALMARYEKCLGQLTMEQREELVSALIVGADARAEVLSYMRLRLRRLQQHREQQQRILMAELGVKAQTATQIASAHNFTAEAIAKAESGPAKVKEGRRTITPQTQTAAAAAATTMLVSTADESEQHHYSQDNANDTSDVIVNIQDSTPSENAAAAGADAAANSEVSPNPVSKTAVVEPSKAASASSAALTRSHARKSKSLSYSQSYNPLNSTSNSNTCYYIMNSAQGAKEYTVPQCVAAELKEYEAPGEPVLGGTRPYSVGLAKLKTRRRPVHHSGVPKKSAAASEHACTNTHVKTTCLHDEATAAICSVAEEGTPLERFRRAFATEVRAIFYEDCLTVCAAVMHSRKGQRRTSVQRVASAGARSVCESMHAEEEMHTDDHLAQSLEEDDQGQQIQKQRALCVAALQKLISQRTGWTRSCAQKYATALFPALQSHWLPGTSPVCPVAVHEDNTLPVDGEAEMACGGGTEDAKTVCSGDMTTGEIVHDMCEQDFVVRVESDAVQDGSERAENQQEQVTIAQASESESVPLTITDGTIEGENVADVMVQA